MHEERQPIAKKPRCGDISTRATQTTPGRPSPRRVSSLPPPLLDAVLSYVVDVENTLHVRDALPLFQALRTVSNEWNTRLDASMSEYILRVLRLCVASATRSAVLEARRQLTLRRARLTHLVLSDQIERDTHTSDDVVCALLSLAPRNLEALVVGPHGRRGSSAGRLTKIVRAATRYCPELRHLEHAASITTPANGQRLSDSSEMKELAMVVYDGMQVWSKHGNGLRFLSFDMLLYMRGPARAKEFFEKVAAFCPNIEDLDGALTAVDRRSGTTSKEQWMLDVSTWESFCRACRQLTEFNWVCVPFATRFFQIFGQFPKPRLQKLTISTPVNWKWTRYRRDVDESTRNALEHDGFAGSATQAHCILRACPSLEQLTVKWYLPDTLSPTASERKINPEIFGDDFCEALARYCHQLTQLEITPNRDLHALQYARSVATMTDRSLRALATLPSLETVRLTGLNVGGPGLFQLVVNHAANTRAARSYFLALGDASQSVTAMAFYPALLGFLMRLVDSTGKLPCANRRVELTLVNNKGAAVEKEWSRQYFATVRRLAAQAKHTHKSIRLQGLVMGDPTATATDEEDGGDDDEVFSRIAEFRFSTGEQLSGGEREWHDGVPAHHDVDDHAIDNVFIKRTVRRPMSGLDTDELDSESEFDEYEDDSVDE